MTDPQTHARISLEANKRLGDLQSVLMKDTKAEVLDTLLFEYGEEMFAKVAELRVIHPSDLPPPSVAPGAVIDACPATTLTAITCLYHEKRHIACKPDCPLRGIRNESQIDAFMAHVQRLPAHERPLRMENGYATLLKCWTM